MKPRRAKTTPASTPGSFAAHTHTPAVVELVDSRAMPEIELYESPDGAIRLEVHTDDETVWLTQAQMAELFGVNRDTIGEHLQNIYADGELARGTTTEDFPVVRQEGARMVRRSLEHFNLDAVLSVGYRVRSASATQFRRWASEVLRRYIMKGSATNERRLKELGVLTDILATSHDENLSGLSDVMRRYTQDFDLLNSYDRGTFDETAGTTPAWSLNLSAAREAIAIVRSQFPNDELFGAERGDGLSTVLDQIEQSSFGQPLYPTVEDRAAHLIYFTVKNHPLSDGNKRSAVALASYYLAKNGAAPLPENTLAALTLVTAASGPEQKDQIVGVLRTVLTKNK